jgi:hypothetical protein
MDLDGPRQSNTSQHRRQRETITFLLTTDNGTTDQRVDG